MTVEPESITQPELAEALDHELDSSWVGGRELAVNVFHYVRARRRERGEQPVDPGTDEYRMI